MADALSGAGVLDGEWPALVVHVADNGFIDVGAMAFLCTWARGRANGGARIHFRGDDRAIRYLARMDLTYSLLLFRWRRTRPLVKFFRRF